MPRTVTPGNRGAAVVAGLNVIIFTTIFLLARRERLQQKRSGELDNASGSSEPSTPISEDYDEKTASSGIKAVSA